MRLAFLGILLTAMSVWAADGAIPVQLVQQDGAWTLQREGRPFLVKGAGGSGPLALLARMGANTGRTWGMGKDTAAFLDEAQLHHLAVVVGLWLGHERHGFDWSDAAAVQRQSDEVRAAVLRCKDHPAVLAWGLGNEMEGFKDGDNEAMWKAIQDLAKMIHQLDPRHPIVTTVAELGGRRLACMHRLCPDIDIVGINTYGGCPSIPERYRAGGGTKPYLVTEFGPPGTWEIPRNPLGVVDEPTSTAKGTAYRRSYDALAKDRQLCLGSIAFTWGAKMEATPTWFGMLLPDGTRLAACDQLAEAWSGRPPANRCPAITALTLEGPATVKAGARVKLALAVSDPEQDALAVEWVVAFDSGNYSTGGDAQAVPTTFPEAVLRGDAGGAEVKLPEGGGIYRIFAYVRDGKGGGAVANVTLRAEGRTLPPRPGRLTLPAGVYGGADEAHWTPSGWMGDAKAIAMDPANTEQPRTPGASALKVAFNQGGGWGGVVWQHPANDWGDRFGGFDLSEATRLTFWARGRDGGEKVKFGVGLINNDKRWFDTTKAAVELTLTAQWQQYTIDLNDRDLSRIKSGFYWSIVGQGRPLAFWLDAIRYE